MFWNKFIWIIRLFSSKIQLFQNEMTFYILFLLQKWMEFIFTLKRFHQPLMKIPVNYWFVCKLNRWKYAEMLKNHIYFLFVINKIIPVLKQLPGLHNWIRLHLSEQKNWNWNVSLISMDFYLFNLMARDIGLRP